MLDWMMERLRLKDGKQLGNVAMNRKDGKKKNRHDPSTVNDAKTLEEEERPWPWQQVQIKETAAFCFEVFNVFKEFSHIK